MKAESLDVAVRTAAFAFLIEQRQLHGEQLPWSVLTQGFDFAGRRVPLVGPQGIFKPATLPDMPLSITTARLVPGKDPPYADEQHGGADLVRLDPRDRTSAVGRRMDQTLGHNVGYARHRNRPRLERRLQPKARQ